MRLLSEIIAYCKQAPLKGKPVILTVPSQRYKSLVEERLAEELAKGEEGGLFGLRILPFYELCQHVLRRTGETFRLLPGEVRAALIAKAIAGVEERGELSALSSIAHFAGTHAQVLALIDELERAGLSPREVLSKLASTSASDSRYIELGRIYEAYWAELNKLSVYDERKLAFKTREVASALSPGALGFGLLVVDGFDRFNRLQLSVFEALSRQADRTLISFDYVEDSFGNAQEYLWKQKSFKDLREVLGEFKETPMAQGDFRRAESEVFRSLDRALEMEEIVRGVKEALANGVGADEMIVVARSLKPYLPSIKTAFERASIEYFLDEAIPLAGLPLIKYLRRLLSLSIADFERLDVVRVLQSPYCKLESISLSEAEVQEIDALSIKHMVVSGIADWKMLAGSSKLLALLERICLPAVRKTISEHVTYVEDLIDDFLVLANEEEYADPLVFWEEHQSIFEFRRVLANLICEDELLSPHFGRHEITYLEFCRRLDQTFENANFRRPKLSRNAVTICSADLVPNRCFKVIFVSGLIEGEFPRRGGDSGFLSRDEVKKWLSFGIDIENPRHHETFELSLYNSLLDRASEKLVISAPLYELSGEELMPSFFLTSGDSAALAEIPYLKPRQPALTRPVSEEEFALALLFNDFKLDDFADSVEDIYHRLSPALNLVESRTAPGAIARPSLLSGYLVDQVSVGLARVELPELWSVSRLNDYGKCPFRFWVSHVLKIKPPEEPEAGLDALLVGEFYHKALELFYTQLKVGGLTILSEAALVEPIYKQAVEDALEWLSRERPFRETEFWDYEKKELSFRLNRFFVKEKERALRDNEQFLPFVFERGFGFAPRDPESAPALVVKSGDREIRLRGRVDRIDVSQDGKSCRIVDYKSGSARISSKEALAGRNMQMPIYALAVRQSILPELDLRDGVFLSVSQGETIGRLDFLKDGEEVVFAVLEHVGRFVRDIERGDFSVRPSDPQVCTNCDHSQVCRIAELGKSEGESD